jgi:hypothetical protein
MNKLRNGKLWLTVIYVFKGLAQSLPYPLKIAPSSIKKEPPLQPN